MHRCARQLILWVVLGAVGAVGQEVPARDSHQGVTIAAVPVPDTPATEAIFGVTAAPTRAGFLPVELIIRNARPEPVRVTLERALIVTAEGEFPVVAADEIAWALYPPPAKIKPGKKLSKKQKRKRLQREEAEAALRHRQLRVAVVPPAVVLGATSISTCAESPSTWQAAASTSRKSR